MLKGYYDGTQGNRIKITRRAGIQHPNAFALPRQLDIYPLMGRKLFSLIPIKE